MNRGYYRVKSYVTFMIIITLLSMNLMHFMLILYYLVLTKKNERTMLDLLRIFSYLYYLTKKPVMQMFYRETGKIELQRCDIVDKKSTKCSTRLV